MINILFAPYLKEFFGILPSAEFFLSSMATASHIFQKVNLRSIICFEQQILTSQICKNKEILYRL